MWTFLVVIQSPVLVLSGQTLLRSAWYCFWGQGQICGHLFGNAMLAVTTIPSDWVPGRNGSGKSIHCVATHHNTFMKSNQTVLRACVTSSLPVVAAVMFAGCANNLQADALRDAVQALSSPGSKLRTPAEVNAYPYAQLRMQLEGYLPAIAVLAEYVEGDYLWVAGGDFQLLQSPDGRIKRIQVGAQQTLVDWQGLQLQPALPDKYRLTVTLATEADEPASFVVRCAQAESVPASIIVNGQTIDTTRSRYNCTSGNADDVFTMTYWHDADGRIRRSDGRIWLRGRGYLLEALKVPA